MSQSRIKPPLGLLIALLAQLALHFLLPLYQWSSGITLSAGLLLAAAGFGVVLWAHQLFQRARTAICPFDTPRELVTDGPFRFSRNPMYLGMAGILLGLALALGSIGALLVAPVYLTWLQQRFIRHEEQALQREFTTDYGIYRERVARWIGVCRSTA